MPINIIASIKVTLRDLKPSEPPTPLLTSSDLFSESLLSSFICDIKSNQSNQQQLYQDQDPDQAA